MAGGYEDNLFIDAPPESVQCPVCLLVLREPQVLSCCGVHICQPCIESIDDLQQSCPCCRETNYEYMINKQKRSEIWSLKVYCENSEENCEWTGELSGLERHLISAKCPLKYCRHGCGGEYSPYDLQSHEEDECHLRPFDFQRVKQSMNKVASTLEDKYERGNEKMNKKMETVRKNIRNELTVVKSRMKYSLMCILMVLSCIIAYQFYHIHVLKGEFYHLQRTTNEIHKQFSKITQWHILSGEQVPIWHPPILVSPHLLSPCVITVDNFSIHKRLDESWYSPPFYTENGYKLQLGVDANGFGSGKHTHLSLFAYLMKGDNDDILEWPFRGNITVELLNWIEDKEHFEKVISFNDTTLLKYREQVKSGERAIGLGIGKFISHSELEQDHYLHTDALCLRIRFSQLEEVVDASNFPIVYVVSFIFGCIIICCVFYKTVL